MFRVLATAYVTVCALVSFARASLVQNISTGIDRTTGLQLANNAQDPNWVVATGGDGGPYIGENLIARSTPVPSIYLPDSASTASRWDAVNSGLGLEGISLPGTHYNFQTTVNLTGFNPATASIPSGQFAVDDGIVDIKINGTVINLPSGFAQGLDRFYALPSNLGAGLFSGGLNTITFDLINNGSTPQALRLEASVTASPAPEPASVCIVAIGGSLILLWRRRSGYSRQTEMCGLTID